MSATARSSDQFDYWSDNEGQDALSAAAAPPSPPASAPTPGDHSPGLPHRALQALRQTRVPVQPGARPRAEVLLVGEPAGEPTADGLRAGGLPGAGNAVPGQLPEDPADPRRDLRDQPRAASSARGDLSHGAGRQADPADQPSGRRHARGQHDRGAPRWGEPAAGGAEGGRR